MQEALTFEAVPFVADEAEFEVRRPRPRRPGPRPAPRGGPRAAACRCPVHGEDLLRRLRAVLDQAAQAAPADSGPADDPVAPEEELSRSSATYVRWVQAALNRLLGLRLAVDGISGTMTRSAVRDFQARKGLAADGIVGPLTEAALVAAGAGAPPTGAAPAPGAPAPAPSWNSGSVPRSPDGTPLFRQGDPAWGSERLGRDTTIARSGCAMSSMAMAISKISGRVVTPLELNNYLQSHGGYSGNAIYWDVAAGIAGLDADKPGWSLSTIDAQLAAGKPVVVGVDYHEGSGGGSAGTDHWIALTARRVQGGQSIYSANDPADGQVITLTLSGGQLVGPKNYRTVGELVVIR